MSQLPFVSVVIAAHNAEAFIVGAIDSALAQGGVELELLIVDDASNDTTQSVLLELSQKDDRIIPIFSPVNVGPAGVRNLALDRARGDWIAILDSDDSLEPDRLAEMIRAAVEAEADIVIDDFVSVDPDGKILDGDCLADRRAAGILGLDDWVALNSFERSELSFGYAKPIISREFLARTGLRYNETLRNGEDFHLILEALVAGATLYFTGNPGYRYTRRAGSVSRRAQDDHMRALLTADDAVAARLDPKAQSVACALLRKRRENLMRLIVTEDVMGKLKSRQPLSAISSLVRHPGATGRVLGHLGEAVRKRIRGAED
ncbi:glycosyltransferase family 2 protein [Yoonia maritima]|uniref:glycosyltransferase family 2 protein n=1 Tax=Yoonia maritima TaxID=1435347 RepID=UPI0037364599